MNLYYIGLETFFGISKCQDWKTGFKRLGATDMIFLWRKTYYSSNSNKKPCPKKISALKYHLKNMGKADQETR